MFSREYKVLFSDMLQKTGAQFVTFRQKDTNFASFDMVFGDNEGEPIIFKEGDIVKITYELIRRDYSNSNLKPL